uniref:Uncharacterized protein n=1 Tax=Desertifilum tharense IPPAS B-1220 TaxID=1781255 RepID=A0ACD5GWJ3_9CYAN
MGVGGWGKKGQENLVTINSALFSPTFPSSSLLGTPLLGVQATELRTLHSFPHPPIPPFPHPPILFPTRNSELGTNFPHPLPYSALSTLHSALRKGRNEVTLDES